MKTKQDYLNYVHAVLETIRSTEAIPKAAYDTGFGLHIVDKEMGESPMTIYVVGHSLAKVKPPEIEDSDQWDEAWKAGKDLVDRFIDRYKEAKHA